MRQRHLHAFTLIELLVVVAIIVALLAILMPAMAKAVEASQSAVCRSNLHQYSLATLSYTSDHFGAFPLYTSDVTPFQRLRKYWQTDAIKLCPSASSPFTTPALGGTSGGGAAYAHVEARYDTDGDGDLDHEVASYTWNGMCNVVSAWPALGAPTGYMPADRYIPRVADADARVPLIGDGAWTAGFPGATWFAGDQPDAQEWSPTSTSNNSWGLPRWAIRRHAGKTTNLGMADGHATNSTMPKLWVDYRWHRLWPVGQAAPVIPWL